MAKGNSPLKRITMFLLSLIMVLTLMPSMAFAAGGEGTAESPYLIDTAEEFAKMSENGIYKLNADITVTAPYDKTFKGTFDGGGHTIKLDISDKSANIGLFRSLSGAVVKSVNTEGSVSGNANYVGSISGELTGGAIVEDCHNAAALTGSKGNIGGIVGRAYNGATISNSSNRGKVEGSANRVGGIIGYASGGEVSVEHCFNSGAVTGTNNQIGGIVGHSGGTVAITNCYNAGAITGSGQYSNTLGGIVGQATKSGPTDTLINCYNIGSCSFSQSTNTSIGSMVGNKSNNGSTTNCYYLDSSAAVAIGGVTAEGVTAKTEAEMKAADFVEALNGTGDAFVADTADINGGFPILSWQASAGGEEEDVEANLAAVTAAKTAFDKEFGALRPSFKTDKNIVELVQAKVNGYEGCEGVTVSLKNSDEPDWIKEDGAIQYNKGALNSFGMNSKNVSTVFTFTKGTQSVDSANRTATIGWDLDYYAGKIAEEADKLTADKIKGENASLDDVTENLTLPQCMTSSSRTAWSQITWTSSNEDIIKIDKTGYDGITDPKQGTVTRPAEDAVVTLTATFNANDGNLNTQVEKAADIKPEVRTFDVTVKKTEVHVPTEEELQEILDTYYTADRLTDSASGAKIDTAAVMGDIQLPRYTNIKDADNKNVFVNKEITVTSGNEDVITISGYRAVVDRFAINEDTTVDLTIAYKKTGQEITVTKTIPLTVKPLTEDEIADELALMEKAKAAYEDAVLDGQEKSSVKENLHAFQKIYLDESGNAKVAYDSSVTAEGIKADGYWETGQSEEMEASGYNRFKSSAPSILQHENLVLNQPETDTEVTITSWLTSEKYGETAAKYPDNKTLQKLYKQEVSVTVTVKGTKDAADYLKEAIEDAKKFAEGIEEGETPGQYPSGTKAALEAAITDAQRSADKSDATEEDLQAAIRALNEAVEAAKAKRIPPEDIHVSFTCSVKGDLQVTNEQITVGDEDKDGVLTINDAMIVGHREFAPNGADDYASYTTQWGLGVKKLWGDTSNNFGYYRNDQMAFNVSDPIADADAVYAWVYKYTYDEGMEDYSYFDQKEVKGKEGDSVSLKLSYRSDWDKDWNPIFGPLADASVGYYDGSAFVELGKTDASGAVSFAAPVGKVIVTAKAPEGKKIVPPYCVLNMEHELTKTDAVAASCEYAGSIAYWTCGKCGKLFSDEAGTTEIAKEDTIIPASGHNWGEWTVTTEPTLTEEGVETRVCKTDSSHTETRPVAKIAPNAYVDSLIDAIGDVTADSKDAVAKARAAYEELSAADKALVTKLDALEAAEAKLAEIEHEQLAQAKADAIQAIKDAAAKAAEGMDETTAAKINTDAQAAISQVEETGKLDSVVAATAKVLQDVSERKDAYDLAQAKKAAQEEILKLMAENKGNADVVAQALVSIIAINDATDANAVTQAVKANKEAVSTIVSSAASGGNTGSGTSAGTSGTGTSKGGTSKPKADPVKAKTAAAKKLTVKKLKVKSIKRKLVITWKKTKGAKGYQVQYQLKGKKWKTLKLTPKTKLTSKKLKKGKKYRVRVRTYTNVKGKKVYGKWTKAKVVKCK